jgi:mRNA interferase HicA
MKRRDLIKFLQQHGCALIREGGSHSWWGNESLNTRSAVPRRTEINEELAKKICKDLGLPRP